MREGLYKGRKTSDGAWVEGFLIARKDEAYIIETKECEWSLGDCYFDGSVEKVVPETVGEYSGLTDKNGKKIFEGDIVKVDEHTSDVNGVYKVDYSEANCCWDLTRGLYHQHWHFSFAELNGFNFTSEVIGNVYDGMVFEKNTSSVSRKLTRNPIGEEKPQPITLEEANKVFKKNYVDLMNAAIVESSLLKNVSAIGALSKLNQDRLDALASVVGTSFFKGDRK